MLFVVDFIKYFLLLSLTHGGNSDVKLYFYFGDSRRSKERSLSLFFRSVLPPSRRHSNPSNLYSPHK